MTQRNVYWDQSESFSVQGKQRSIAKHSRFRAGQNKSVSAWDRSNLCDESSQVTISVRPIYSGE